MVKVNFDHFYLLGRSAGLEHAACVCVSAWLKFSHGLFSSSLKYYAVGIIVTCVFTLRSILMVEQLNLMLKTPFF